MLHCFALNDEKIIENIYSHSESMEIGFILFSKEEFAVDDIIIWQ
mgnify:CR=1 FL=1|jgi:hypothetical protein